MMFGVIFSSLGMCPSVKRGCKPRLRSRCVLPVGAVSSRAYQRGLANGGRGPVPRQPHARPSIARDRPSHYGQPRGVHSTPLGAVSNRAYQRGLANGGRGPVPRQTHARPSIARDRPSHYGQPRDVHSTPQTQPIFDRIIDDEVQLLLCEAVVFSEDAIDFVNNVL